MTAARRQFVTTVLISIVWSAMTLFLDAVVLVGMIQQLHAQATFATTTATITESTLVLSRSDYRAEMTYSYSVADLHYSNVTSVDAAGEVRLVGAANDRLL